MDIKYLPQMADETARSYLFIAIDRATRWVFIQIMPSKSAANARKFLKALHEACPIKIKHILTDNGKEFTDRLFASRARVPTGEHAFDKLCTELGIEHRLTKCRVPDDCIDPRRYPLFMARATMRALIADVRATKKESVSC